VKNQILAGGYGSLKKGLHFKAASTRNFEGTILAGYKENEKEKGEIPEYPQAGIGHWFWGYSFGAGNL